MVNYLCPTELFIGFGTIKHVHRILSQEMFNKAMIVTDKGIRDAGVVQPLVQELEQNSVDYVVFDGVAPNPTNKSISEAFHFLKQSEADIIIGIGGGSAIDTAKAIAILATNGGEITDYRGVGKVKHPTLPLLAIPTTAGTGSEVTSVTVVTDTQLKAKFSIGSPYITPNWAIIDPELTLTMPPSVTAYTGIDALTHAIEAYTSRSAHVITDALAKEAIKKISSNLRTAVYKGENVCARKEMLEGSLIAGLAFSSAKLGLCHVLCNPLGAHYNIPHGLANAILLPYVTRFNLPAEIEKYAHIALLLGEAVDSCTDREMAEKAVSAIEKLNADVGIPSTLAEVGVEEKLLPQMAEECCDNPLVNNNPRRARKEDLLTIFQHAFHGEVK